MRKAKRPITRARAKLRFISAALLALAVATGCSFFSMKNDSRTAESSSFRRTVSADAMPMPLPVEIADDINKIAKGQAPEPPQGGWQAAPPVQMQMPAPQEAETRPGETPVAALETSPVEETHEIVPVKRRPSSTRGKTRRAGSKRIDYKVKSGDTLMKISYEKFGNLYRWREIYNANKAKIPNFNSLVAGTILTIDGVEYEKIVVDGQPYLIRRGDTLVKISRQVYQSPAFWRSLWENNRLMIRDPNKIYAGFTLYYLDQPVRSTLAKKSPAKKPTTVKKVEPIQRLPARLPQVNPVPSTAPAAK